MRRGLFVILAVLLLAMGGMASIPAQAAEQEYKTIVVVSMEKNKIHYYDTSYTAADGMFSVGKEKTMKLSPDAVFTLIPQGIEIGPDTANVPATKAEMKKRVKRYAKQGGRMLASITIQMVGGKKRIIEMQEFDDFYV